MKSRDQRLQTRDYRRQTADCRLQTKKKKRGLFLKISFVFVFCLQSPVSSLPSNVFAADKSWNAGGDQSDWFDDANWLPAGKPTASDDAKIDMLSASSTLSQSFDVKSLTLGGKKASTLTVSNFVAGNVKPANGTDIAFLNRKDGHLILKGSAGKITLKGAYRDSEEVIPEEPSFMFYVQ